MNIRSESFVEKFEIELRIGLFEVFHSF